jgi:hypothetical protein
MSAIENIERFVAESERFSGVDPEQIFGLNGVNLSVSDLRELVRLARLAPEQSSDPESFCLADKDPSGHWVFAEASGSWVFIPFHISSSGAERFLADPRPTRYRGFDAWHQIVAEYGLRGVRG